MRRLLNIVDKVSLGFAYLAAALVIVMMVSIGYDVVMRHVFNRPTIWADELSCYLLVGISFLGAAYALNTDSHVRIEALIEYLPPGARTILEFFTDLVSVIFLGAFTWQAFQLVIKSYATVRIAPTLLRTPLYLPQLFLAVGLMWFAVQMLAHMLKRIVDAEAGSVEKEKTVRGRSERKL